MDDKRIREALSLLESGARPPEGLADALFARLLQEIEAPAAVELARPPRRTSRRRLVPIGAAAALIGIVAATLVLVPRSPSAFAVLERARERFRRAPVHLTISNATQAFGENLEPVMETEVVEHWFESETRWRSRTISHNLFPNLAGNFTVMNEDRIGRWSAEQKTFDVEPAATIDDPYMLSGLAMHDPTIGVWATSTGIKPTPQFLDEDCRVATDTIAGRAAERLECRTGLEGDTLREATVWLDRETGFILKLQTTSCGTIKGERRCGPEAIREVKSIEFDPSFPVGIFDVEAPEGG